MSEKCSNSERSEDRAETSKEEASASPQSSATADLEKQDVDTKVIGEQTPQHTIPAIPAAPDPDSARNWNKRKKWAAVVTASGFGFISIASSMLAPALPAIGRDLDISNKSDLQMVLSIFILAYAVGPLLLGPLSEAYDRVWVLQLASTMFCVFNLACGFAQNYSQIVAFRFLAGIGGSAPQSIGVGILADCFSSVDRGPALRIYTLAPLLGPAVGPIIAGIIAARTTWRWIFWSLSIANAVVQICALFWLHESWEPAILKAKAKKLQLAREDPSAATIARSR